MARSSLSSRYVTVVDAGAAAAAGAAAGAGAEAGAGAGAGAGGGGARGGRARAGGGGRGRRGAAAEDAERGEGQDGRCAWGHLPPPCGERGAPGYNRGARPASVRKGAVMPLPPPVETIWRELEAVRAQVLKEVGELS